jgi:hypothetical protein
MSAYTEALKREKGNISRCDDAAAMAGFLQSAAQILLGAVSAELIWDGAQAEGLTSLELNRLIHDDPDSARDLMWPAGEWERRRRERYEAWKRLVRDRG